MVEGAGSVELNMGLMCALQIGLLLSLPLAHLVYLISKDRSAAPARQDSAGSSRLAAFESSRLLVFEPGNSTNENQVFDCLRTWHNYVRLFAHFWAGNYFHWDIMADAITNTQRIGSTVCVNFTDHVYSLPEDCQQRIQSFYTDLITVFFKAASWQFAKTREGLRSTIQEAYNISTECKPVSQDLARKRRLEKYMKERLGLFFS